MWDAAVTTHSSEEIRFELVFFFLLFCSGKKNKLRVYYLSWLRNRILHNDPEVEKKQGWITVGELEGCVHYKVGTETQSCVVNSPTKSEPLYLTVRLS